MSLCSEHPTGGLYQLTPVLVWKEGGREGGREEGGEGGREEGGREGSKTAY